MSTTITAAVSGGAAQILALAQVTTDRLLREPGPRAPEIPPVADGPRPIPPAGGGEGARGDRPREGARGRETAFDGYSAARGRSEAARQFQARRADLLAALERLLGGDGPRDGPREGPRPGDSPLVYVFTGAGNDTVTINDVAVGAIDAGAGDDAVAVATEKVRSIEGGAGNDALSAVAGTVGRVHGGDGSDAIAVDAAAIGALSGGTGDDAIAAAAERIGAVHGGLGADSIALQAARIGSVEGGAGNDTIAIVAIEAGLGRGISGGAGDDTISVAAERARFTFGSGDGNDRIAFGGPTQALIDIADELAASAADIAVGTGPEGETIVSFAGGESITLEGLAGSSVSLRLADGSLIDLAPPPPPPPVPETPALDRVI